MRWGEVGRAGQTRPASLPAGAGRLGRRDLGRTARGKAKGAAEPEPRGALRHRSRWRKSGHHRPRRMMASWISMYVFVLLMSWLMSTFTERG